MVQDYCKATFFAKKKAGMSQEEFIDYTLDNHVPLVMEIPGIQGYVQNFADSGVENAPFSTLSEVWFDTEQDLWAGLQSPEGEKALADRAEFLDEHLPHLILQERIVIDPQRAEPGQRNGHSTVKTTYLIPPKAGVSLEEVFIAQFRDYVPTALAALGDTFKGYEINYVESLSSDLPYCMVIHGWFSSKDALAEKYRTEPRMDTLQQIQKEFYDFEGIKSFDVIEYVAKMPPSARQG